MSKLSKSKIIGITTVSLAAVSLLGVGFSSWILNPTVQNKDANVTVTVGEVEDKRIKVDLGTYDNTVKFDADSSAADAGTLITPGAGSSEDLVFTIVYTASDTADSNGYFAGSKTATPQIVLSENITRILGNGSDVYATLSATSSLSGATWSSADNKTWTSTSGHIKTGSLTETITFTFAWGSFFGNKNPVCLTDSTQVDSYLTALNDMKTAASSGISAVLTVTPDA